MVNKLVKGVTGHEPKTIYKKQNKTLEQIRDTLLPKLMNGEIDLDKIEI